MGSGLLSPTHIAVVLAIALIVFGPKRLPELGRALGNGMREFKDTISGFGDDHDTARELPPTATPTPSPAVPMTQPATPPPQAEPVTPSPAADATAPPAERPSSADAGT